MRTSSTFIGSLGSLLLLAAACGGGSIDQINLPAAGAGGAGGTTGGTGGTTGGTGGTTGSTGGTTGGTGGTTGGTGGTGGTTGGTGATTGGTGGSVMAGAGGAPAATGGVGGSVGGVGGSGGLPMGGTAGAEVDPTGGMPGAGGASPMGGMGGTGAEAGSGGSAGAPATGPYAPRTGPFKVLAYSKTSGFRHTDAIDAGKPMLTAMGTKQGFEVTFTEDPGAFNATNLAQYELVFGLNPTGNNLSATQKADFQAWMETKNGAFAGVHSSTDHESGWAFWSDVTGQTYDSHDMGTFTTQNINWEPGVGEYVFVKGLPSPWSRAEEWYKFNSYSSWSQKPGFKILNLVNSSQGGTRPVSYIREWGNFRSFYTSLGHNGSNYTEATFVRHVGAGIMWAARREALFTP